MSLACRVQLKKKEPVNQPRLFINEYMIRNDEHILQVGSTV